MLGYLERESNTSKYGLMGSHAHPKPLYISRRIQNNCAYDAVPWRPDGWQLMCMFWRMEPLPECGPIFFSVMHPIERSLSFYSNLNINFMLFCCCECEAPKDQGLSSSLKMKNSRVYILITLKEKWSLFLHMGRVMVNMSNAAAWVRTWSILL